MGVFSNTYIDDVFASRDVLEIWSICTAIERSSTLPEPLWLYCRVMEWVPVRGGVWQMYEGVDEAELRRFCSSLLKVGLDDLATKLGSGLEVWEDDDAMAALDAWLASNAKRIHDTVVDLAMPFRVELYGLG